MPCLSDEEFAQGPEVPSEVSPQNFRSELDNNGFYFLQKSSEICSRLLICFIERLGEDINMYEKCHWGDIVDHS